MPVSTECAAALLSFRYPSFKTLSISPARGIEPATDPALQSSALPPELILRGVSHA